MRFGVRLFPILIFTAALMLTVRVGNIWNTLMNDDQGASGQTVEIRNTLTAPAVAQDADIDNAFADDGFEELEGEVPDGMTRAELTEEDDRFSDVASLTPGELRLLHELADRRDEIEGKERELAEREALLRAAEQQLVVTQERLVSLRDEIKELVVQYDDEQEAEQARLRSIYSAMKPKSAAAIFNDLDMETLVGLLRGISPRKVAPIIAAMNPERARLLTRELAESEELPVVPN